MDIFGISFRRYRAVYFSAIYLLTVLVACAGGSGGGNDIPVPSGVIAINGGDAYTQSRNVTISCDVENAAEMRFSNDQAAWSEWEQYEATKYWSIDAGHGIKTVYGEFRGAAGGTAIVSDTIVPLVEEKITASDPVANAYFGGGTWGYTTNSIALSGDGTRLFAGCSASHEKVYVYMKNSTGEWNETIINSPNTTRYDHFGQSLDCTPDASTLVIGALGGVRGAVFIYEWDGAEYLLRSTIEHETSHDFGVNLVISDNGESLLVGAWVSNSGFLFEKLSGQWALSQEFHPAEVVDGDRYGLGLGISGDGNIIVIGAPTQNGYTGSIYIYRYDGTEWGLPIKKASPFTTQDVFGRHIAVSENGDRIVVGLRFWNLGSATQGAAFIYDWDGSDYVLSDTIRASDNLTGVDDKFGYCVSMTPDGNTVVISAPGRYTDMTHSEVGTYYIFRGSGTGWNEEQRVLPLSPVVDRFFGYLTRISDDGSTIAIGAPCYDGQFTDQGAVFLYH